MGKKCNPLWNALGWILLVIVIFVVSAVLQYKFKFLGELPNLLELKRAQISPVDNK